MLKKTKDEHIKNMMKELSEVKISTKEGESPYLVDYLYGVSDVEKEIKEYFESYFSSEEEWILISRVLISREILKKKEYHKISTGNSEYFLMRDLEDIIKFKKYYEHKIEHILSEVKEKTEKVINKYEKIINDSDLFNEFKELTEAFLYARKIKDNSGLITTNYHLGEFMKENKKSLGVGRVAFYRKDLCIKDNNLYYKWKKEYEGMNNDDK